MQDIYLQIWQLSKPYYQKGRPMDIKHIEWFMQKVDEVCEQESLDKTLLMPLAILHDIGYATLADIAETNYYDKDIRKAHMEAGAKLAGKILESVNYPKNKSKQIIKYISVHDDWAFGKIDVYLNDRILGTFKDLDYLWIYTQEGCRAIQKVLKKNNAEMLKHLEQEVSPIYGKKPFSTPFTKKLREKYLTDRKQEMHPIIRNLQQQLKQNADAKTQASGQRFFKEAAKLYGIKTATVGKIGKEAFKEIKAESKEKIFSLCEELWRSGYMEETFIACNWSYNVWQQYERKDFIIFESWAEKYINNWASCDTFCNHTVGKFVEIFPEYITQLKKWTKSKNRWVKRASAVSLIIPARNGKFLKDIFEIADSLLLDSDDMVQKGYGWMLKAASQAHQQEVFDYVMKNKAVMPRTSLRYAIEKMPTELKKKAMAK